MMCGKRSIKRKFINVKIKIVDMIELSEKENFIFIL